MSLAIPAPHRGVPPDTGTGRFLYLTYIGMYRFNRVFAEHRPMLEFRALGDVTIVTAMSTLVGLELWTDHIGPQTKEQAPPFLTRTVTLREASRASGSSCAGSQINHARIPQSLRWFPRWFPRWFRQFPRWFPGLVPAVPALVPSLFIAHAQYDSMARRAPI